MTKFLLALHLAFVIFAIGPLVHAATTAARGVRQGDVAAIGTSVRTLRVYAVASLLVVGVGFALMSRPALIVSFGGASYHGRLMIENASAFPSSTQPIASLGETWIWLSLLLWALSIAVVFALLVPALRRARTTIEAGEPTGALPARVAAGGGIVALSYLVITALMVYRPGR